MTRGTEEMHGAVDQLAKLYWLLPISGASIFEDCAALEAFLESLVAAQSSLGLQTASRSYRSNFTENYRSLFPSETQNYSVDILQASQEQSKDVWVNSESFEISAGTLHSARDLQKSFAAVCNSLERWRTEEDPVFAPKPAHLELRRLLLSLDLAWADFEMRYVNELIDIERYAKNHLVRAIEAEQNMRALEDNPWKKKQALWCPEYIRRTKTFLASLAKLNRISNPSCNGRCELSAKVLLNALKIIRRCNIVEKAGGDCRIREQKAAAQALFLYTTRPLDAMRNYLVQVKEFMGHVNPHLGQNEGLVTRLVELEEAWGGLGARYIQSLDLLTGFSDVVVAIRYAQNIAPSLSSMCAERDVDAFLVIPRLVWLRGLTDRSLQASILKQFLPHRFLGLTDQTGESFQQALPDMASQDTWRFDAALSKLVRKFEQVCSTLTTDGSSAAFDMLIHRAVNGSHDKKLYEALEPRKREQAGAAVEEFMNQLEAWSMELQRHNPKDWNEFIAMILKCLSGGSSEEGIDNGVSACVSSLLEL